MTTARTILLVDDNAAFRSSTAWLLGGLGYEVREFESADALLAAVDGLLSEGCTPCVLTDLRMPGKDGLQLHDALNARALGWPLVYMTGHGDVPLAVAAMRKGAFSFLEKPFRDALLEETLAHAFEAARPRDRTHGGATARVGAAVSPGEGRAAGDAPTPGPAGTGAAAAAAAVRSTAQAAADAATVAGLTPRERQVLELVVQGRLNKTIADVLGISIKTVELHRANMMQKMGARSITDLMRCVLTGERGRG